MSNAEHPSPSVIGRVMAIIVLVLDGGGVVYALLQLAGLLSVERTWLGIEPPRWLAVGSTCVAGCGALAALLVLGRQRAGARLALAAAVISGVFLVACATASTGAVVQLYNEVNAPSPAANDETTRASLLRVLFTVATTVGVAAGTFYRGLFAWAVNRRAAFLRNVG